MPSRACTAHARRPAWQNFQKMGLFRRLIKRKHVDWETLQDSSLNRCLTTRDLISLGVGSTLGASIYVLTGQVAADKAGPAIVLSYFVAGIASLLSGICYAEFGARVPKAGSAYVYAYIAVGEIVAFLIGWNLLLEYVIGTASVARALSGNFDTLLDGAMENYFNHTVVERWQWHMPAMLAPYPDVFAFAIVMLLSFVLSLGVKESTSTNDILSAVNILVIVYVVVCGSFKIDFRNWNIKPEDIPADEKVGGKGGFFPYGLSGAMAGASSCFYAFIGFDVIATTGEETINPSHAIPLGITGSLLIVFVAYVSSAAVLTLMVPYYKFHGKTAPLPFAFAEVGWPATKYFISAGALCGLTSSLLVGMFPMARIVYAMANDGLLYQWTGRVSSRFKTPLIATLLTGFLGALFAMLFSLDQLVEMMSIGTLMAYMMVAVCVVILRYSPDSLGPVRGSQDPTPVEPHSSLPMREETRALSPIVLHRRELSRDTSIVANIAIVLCVMFIFSLCAVLVFAEPFLAAGQLWSFLITAVIIILFILSMTILVRQPQNRQPLAFSVPLVPYFPMLSILINAYLMLKLSPQTWMRFIVWLTIGLFIYFTYGIWHSRASLPDHEDFDAARLRSTSDGLNVNSPAWPTAQTTARVVDDDEDAVADAFPGGDSENTALLQPVAASAKHKFL